MANWKEMVLAGLHHVTALAGDPQRNLDFYTRTLGLRLVKRTVNFDDPNSYHFYFSTADGAPGTLLTFFPWVNGRQPVAGSGQISEVALRGSYPEASDPDGLPLRFVDPEKHRGIDSVTLTVHDAPASARFFRDVLGCSTVSEAGDEFRMAVPGGGFVNLVSSSAPRGKLGAGSIHHVAFRVADEAAQLECRERLIQAGVHVSGVRDRLYFHSIYFREPGGILLEIATAGPGFAIDEEPEHLGERLSLPPWLEPSRESIEKRLPPITVAVRESA